MEKTKNIDRIETIAAGRLPEKSELAELLATYTEEERTYAACKARKVARSIFGRQVFLRGLIEISNYCKNDCYYCGIRRSNKNASRYRLTEDEILACCRMGYADGFRTFVLQGGEDPYFTDERVSALVSRIRESYPDCAITLSLGERERESYQRFFDAGADRYLLRHETACPAHYGKLHPPELSLAHRMQCLKDLKEIGYQTGAGCMVGAPFQTPENLAEDFYYLYELRPEMIGIGPFIPHKDTPFRDQPPGTLRDTLFLLSLFRLLFPRVLLPATTALGTIQPDGREQGILAGANVVMPNISPEEARRRYLLYDGKAGSVGDGAVMREKLRSAIRAVGYDPVVSRGDYPKEGGNDHD